MNNLSNENNNIIQITENMLSEARASISKENTHSIPIAQISALGAGVSPLIPAFNTITNTATFQAEGLYRLANASIGDTLKVAKNGNFWGAFKTASGSSKFAQLQSIDPVSITTESVQSFNPATVMMAVALFSIEQQLGKIEKMEQEILSFLEIEKESEIEADIETLCNMISNYKLNWDNEQYISSSHKLILDIQRTARKNMNSYQKKVMEIVDSKDLLVMQSKVKSTLTNLEKQFNYYRLSLFAFALSSFMEIMIGGNFKEEYIISVKSEIEKLSNTYREVFEKGSIYLENIGHSSIETNILKGIGIAGKSVGKLIGNIPVVKDGPVDELLENGGAHIQDKAQKFEKKAVHAIANLGNPGVGILLDKMDDILQIYNYTNEIYFDNEQLYLVSK